MKRWHGRRISIDIHIDNLDPMQDEIQLIKPLSMTKQITAVCYRADQRTQQWRRLADSRYKGDRLLLRLLKPHIFIYFQPLVLAKLTHSPVNKAAVIYYDNVNTLGTRNMKYKNIFSLSLLLLLCLGQNVQAASAAVAATVQGHQISETKLIKSIKTNQIKKN